MRTRIIAGSACSYFNVFFGNFVGIHIRAEYMRKMGMFYMGFGFEKVSQIDQLLFLCCKSYMNK